MPVLRLLLPRVKSTASYLANGRAMTRLARSARRSACHGEALVSLCSAAPTCCGAAAAPELPPPLAGCTGRLRVKRPRPVPVHPPVKLVVVRRRPVRPPARLSNMTDAMFPRLRASSLTPGVSSVRNTLPRDFAAGMTRGEKARRAPKFEGQPVADLSAGKARPQQLKKGVCDG